MPLHERVVPGQAALHGEPFGRSRASQTAVIRTIAADPLAACPTRAVVVGPRAHRWALTREGSTCVGLR